MTKNEEECYDRGWDQGRIDLVANALAELRECAKDYRFDFDMHNYELVEKVFLHHKYKGEHL